MKKIFMVFALMAMLMLPLTSFSMTAMEEGDLSSVTGQAGVSINLDARVDLVADTVAWGDLDGFVAPSVTVTDNAGWVGLSDLVVSNLRVRADQTLLKAEFYTHTANGAALKDAGITLFGATQTALGAYMMLSGDLTPTLAEAIAWNADPAGGAGAITTQLQAVGVANAGVQALVPAVQADALGGNTDAAAALVVLNEKSTGTFTPFSPLTIDVATGTTAVPFYGDGITFVRIGLGSLQVEMDSMVADVELGPDTGYPGAANGVPNLKYQLGSLYLGDLGLRIGGNSYVDIFNARGGTAQGVTIVTDVIIKEFSIGTLAWGDKDGIDWAFSYDAEGVYGYHTIDSNLQTLDPADPVADAAGWVGLKDLNIDWLEVSGRIDIDVATAYDAEELTDWTFVNIGLTDLTVNMSGLTATAALGATPVAGPGVDGIPGNADDDLGLNQELGELYISDAIITVNGEVAIGARADGTQGVTLDLSDVTVDISQGLTVSWGDLDGVGGTSAAGYVGLVGLNINTLSLTGKVAIDVATIDAADPDTGTTIQDMMYLGYRENNLSPTIIHIGLGSGNADDPTMVYNELTEAWTFVGDAIGVNLNVLSGAVAFGNAPNLIGGTVANTLGNLYMGGVKVGINGWVDIAAH